MPIRDSSVRVAEQSMILPFITHGIEGLGGQLRVSPEDFRVDEVARYLPEGRGDHTFLRIEKRDLTTRHAVKRIADALGADPRMAGWAGMKDRRAVTTQWVSFLGIDPAAALDVELPGIRVLEARRHPHKLKVGHLAGNRFQLILRDVDPERVVQAQAVMETLSVRGCPNYFGEQRFGRDGDTLGKARRWLVDNERAPRDRFARRLYVSALQSAVFNRVLAERVRDDALDEARVGDLMKKEQTGGLFVCNDVDIDQQRLTSWEISPTGPMHGSKMKEAEADVGRVEEQMARELGLTPEVVGRFGRNGMGTRRALRVRPERWSVQRDGEGLKFVFELRAGAYATVIMREIQKG